MSPEGDVADLDTVLLALISGLAGAVIGGIVSGYYAITAVRKQSLRSFKQEAYDHALRLLGELLEITEGISVITRLKVEDGLSAMAQLSLSVSSMAYFLSDTVFDTQLSDLSRKTVDPKDTAALRRAATEVRDTAVGSLAQVLIRHNHRFYSETYGFELCQPGEAVLALFAKTKVSTDELAKSLNARLSHEKFGGPDVTDAQLGAELVQAEADLSALQKAMVDDLKATLG